MKEYKNIKEIVGLCREEIENGECEISATLDYDDLKELVWLYDKFQSLEKEIKLMKGLNIDKDYIKKTKVATIIKDLEENGYWEYLAKRDLKITIEKFRKLLEE